MHVQTGDKTVNLDGIEDGIYSIMSFGESMFEICTVKGNFNIIRIL